FEREFFLQEHFNYINPCPVCGPMQTGDSLGRYIDIQSHPQKKLDHAGSAVLAGPRKAALHLHFRRTPFQTSLRVEKGFDQVQPSHPSRSLEIQESPSFGEMLGGLAATVSQTGVN